jgi:hypothetical protein
VSQCVCARAPHKRVCAISLSLSLSFSLSLSLSLCMHRGIDNHKVRGDKEHGPQAAGVRVRSVPAAIGSQHALARCQQPPRDFVAADSQKFQAAAEGDRGRKPIFVRALGSTIWYSTVARLVHRRCWRVPCSPEKGFLKKRGMPARCTSVGVMLGVGVGVCVRVCERVRKSCRRTREREREREICVAQGPSRPPPASRSTAPFSCTTTSLLRYTSRHTWPSLLSPAAHPVTSDGLSPLQPHVPLPPVPPRPPRISRAT